MPPVILTILKVGKEWSLQVSDARGVRSLGEATNRGDIEALALSVIDDAKRHGERIELTIVPSRREMMAA